jgi:hypothetical protein
MITGVCTLMSNSDESRNVDLDAKSDATEFQQSKQPTEHPPSRPLSTPYSALNIHLAHDANESLIEKCGQGEVEAPDQVNWEDRYTQHFPSPLDWARTTNDTWHDLYD